MRAHSNCPVERTKNCVRRLHDGSVIRGLLPVSTDKQDMDSWGVLFDRADDAETSVEVICQRLATHRADDSE